MEHDEWDFTAVYFDALDHFSHGFMKYHPPKLAKIKEEDFERYQYVVRNAYIFHDEILGKLLNKVDRNTNIILISDHGFHAGKERPTALPKFSAAPALEHNPFGVFIGKGPAFESNKTLENINLLDITPTILQLFNLPIGQDMDGRVIKEALKDKSKINYISTWEGILGDFGEHPEYLKDIGFENADSLNQLEELGYIEKSDNDNKTRIENSIFDSEFHLAQVHFDMGRQDEGLKILEQLYRKKPDDTRVNLLLIEHYLDKNLIQSAKETIQKFKTQTKEKLVKFTVYDARILLIERKHDEALDLLHQELSNGSKTPILYYLIGKSYFYKKHFKKAATYFQKMISAKSSYVPAYIDLGQAYLEQNQFENGLEIFLKALQIQPKNYLTHHHIGRSLVFLKKEKDSIEAFKNCLKLNPNFNKAQEELMRIYSLDDDYTKQLLELKNEQKRLSKEDIVVVSGLPRSGTSMMMQILKNGGFEVHTDGVRKPDANNPNGYFEAEEAKNLTRNKAWLKNCVNKAVKIVLPHFFALPKKYKYKVIFMRRDIDDILISQEMMKNRNNPSYDITYNFGLRSKFESEIKKIRAWKADFYDSEILFIDYEQAIANPEVVAEKVNIFLGSKYDVIEMTKSIDKNLNRTLQKTQSLNY